MKDGFFLITQDALDNITNTFNTVWPISVGLWNLRCQVNGVKHEYPTITEAQLAAKFSTGSGIHGVNYKHAFFESTWEKQQEDFAWILLNSTIPVFEGWLESLQSTVFEDMNIKKMQFPVQAINETHRLCANKSQMLSNCLYPVYAAKRNRSIGKIDNLLLCYRYFKELRNCYMHNGKKADSKLVDAYTNYIAIAVPHNFDVTECPASHPVIEGESITISLRGVVGLSAILFKIILTLDNELMVAIAAEEKEFIPRWNSKHVPIKTLKPDVSDSEHQVARYVNQCGFPRPTDLSAMRSYLISKRLVSR